MNNQEQKDRERLAKYLNDNPDWSSDIQALLNAQDRLSRLEEREATINRTLEVLENYYLRTSDANKKLLGLNPHQLRALLNNQSND